MTLLFSSLAFIDSSSAQCTTCTTTYTVPNGSTVYLSSSNIPSTGNSYCLEVSGILRVDDSWNANDICIKLAAAGRIIIESGNHLCNLSNSSIKPLYNNLINPFKVDAGSSLQLVYSEVEDVDVGFRGQGNIWLYDVDVDGWGQQGVGIVGSSSGNVTVDECTFDNLLAGLTLQGVTGNLSVTNSSFTNIDLHGISATAVSGAVSVDGNDFDNIQTGMSFATSSSLHFITDNTTTLSVGKGLFANGLGDVYINNNSFSFEGVGAELEYIENLNVNNNIFISSQSGPQNLNRIGLKVTGSFGKITSNEFQGMDVGAFFIEKNGFDNNFTANEFTGDQTVGLYIEHGGKIGPQCHQRNKWLGTYTHQYAAYSPDWNVKYNSKFIVNSNNMGEMPPTHYPTGWFKHSSEPCITDSDPSNPGLPGLPEGDGIGNNENVSARGVSSPDQVNVFPNPASNSLKISLPSFSKNIKVVLSDLTGKIIRRTNVNDDLVSYQIDLSDTNSGIYIISVQSNSFRFTERIIVSK